MQLAILTAVLAAIATAESGGGPVAHLGWRLLIIASAVLVAPLAALAGKQRLIAASVDDADVKAARLEALIIALWLVAVAMILLVAQWPRIVRANWQLAGLPLVDEVAILIPVIAPLLLIWAVTRGRQRLMPYLWLQVRQQLALLLLPPLAVVGVLESVIWFKLAPASIDAAWWFVLPLVGTTLVLMPAAVRRCWHTTPLTEPQLRGQLDSICHSRRCQVREILVWNTRGTMANAAVVGTSGWLRYLLLSDVLLARLSDNEIAAVVRHELAHLRRWHLPLRLAALLLPVAWWMALQRTFPDAPSAFNQLVAAITLGNQAVTALIAPLGLLAYVVIVIGWYSRLLEHDADLDACLDDDGNVNAAFAADFCTALMTLCGRGSERWLSQWLHPGVCRRVEFVHSIIANHRLAAAFRRRLWLIAAVIGVLYLAAAAIALLA